MPYRKKRARKPVRNAIPEAAVEAFKEALPLRPHRELQLVEDDSCAGRGECEVCDRYEALVSKVHSLTGVTPQDTSPFDVVDTETPPPWFNDDRQRAWVKALELRKALDERAGLESPTGINLAELSRAVRNIRWMERYMAVPEGQYVGKPVKLRTFQREIVRGVYQGADFGTDGMTKDEKDDFAHLLEKHFRAQNQPRQLGEAQ